MRVLNLGSINIDTVFVLPHLVRAGETLAALQVRQFPGGKGANQSVALARAGAQVCHAGRVGADGQWVLEQMRKDGVDVSRVALDESRHTGSAIIQLAADGQNAILFDAGANAMITRDQIDATMQGFSTSDMLLVQNEVSEVGYAIGAAAARGMKVAFNPAPMSDAVRGYPLDAVDLLIVNEVEAEALTGKSDPEAALASLPGRRRLLTIGQGGVLYREDGCRMHAPAECVDVVDTTAAGDTFIGYFLAAQSRRLPLEQALELACRASALCVTRPGAIPSIPRLAELQ